MSVDQNADAPPCPSCHGHHQTEQELSFPFGGSLLREVKVRHLCKHCGACTHEVGGEWRLYWMTASVFFPSLAVLAWSALFMHLAEAFHWTSWTGASSHVLDFALRVCIVSAAVFLCLFYRDIYHSPSTVDKTNLRQKKAQ